MRYFDELVKEDQAKVVAISDLPLFKPFEGDTRKFLTGNKHYIFDEKLNPYYVGESNDNTSNNLPA